MKHPFKAYSNLFEICSRRPCLPTWFVPQVLSSALRSGHELGDLPRQTVLIRRGDLWRVLPLKHGQNRPHTGKQLSRIQKMAVSDTAPGPCLRAAPLLVEIVKVLLTLPKRRFNTILSRQRLYCAKGAQAPTDNKEDMNCWVKSRAMLCELTPSCKPYSAEAHPEDQGLTKPRTDQAPNIRGLLSKIPARVWFWNQRP